MDNIIECRLNSTCKEIFAGLWQHDYGQILRITGADLPKAVEVQFSLKDKGGDTLTRIGTTVDGATEVKVPDSLLKNENCTQNYLIYAWIYVTDDTSGNTEYKIILHVKSRSKPEKPTEEPLPEPNIFHETVEAVNVSAERAEKAASDAENIRDNLNLDLSEKITRPDTAKVGQVLAVKEIDESGKPTVFEAEDVKVPTKTSELENDSGFLTEHQDISGKLDTEKLPEAIDTALAQAKESGAFDGKDGANGKDGTPGEQGPKGDPGETTYIENPYDDTELKSEIATKITAPENPEVGKAFKIKSVNDDGTFIGEWADCANLDVRINGESIVRDGVAEIPLCTNSNTPGLVTIDAYPTSGGLYRENVKTGLVRINKATDDMISKRSNGYCPIVPLTLDYAVKSAMCDGKGVAWTADEQTMARERMDAEQGSYRLIADMVLEEDIKSIVIDKDLNGEPLSLKTARVIVQHPVPRESGKNNGYVIINKTKGVYGAVDWKRDNQATYAMVDVYVYGENTPAFITFSSAVPILVAQTRYMLTSRGNVVQYFEKINAITVMSNYYFDAGTRITILGKE